MIKERTIFILGAGASKPYGLPTGPELKADILYFLNRPGQKLLSIRNYSRLKYSGNSRDLIRNAAGVTESGIDRFVRDFDRSPISSIDSFISKRSDYSVLGRTAIAFVISLSEKSNELFASSDNWMGKLFEYMMVDTYPSNFSSHQIKFITYNYDRSLEFYLLDSLKTSFGIDDTEAAKILKQISIYHVHGKLAGLIQLRESHSKEYNGIVKDADQLAGLKDHIRIVSDKENVYQPDEMLMHIFDYAKRVYFLGFSFNQENINKLKLNKYAPKDVIIKGSCYGMSKQEKKRVESIFDSKIELHKMKNLEFLREEIELI
ncbi:hypothetical protein ES705_14156 [subsurface metagenome]